MTTDTRPNDALQAARDALASANIDMKFFEEWAEASPDVPAPALLLASAQAYAAIATAEAAQRQATALERIAEILDQATTTSVSGRYPPVPR